LLKAPVELVVKFTLPTGVETVPGELSLTVAVHAWSTPKPVEAQLTTVLVARWPTEIVEAPVLTEWAASPLYDPVIIWFPAALGVYETLQLATPEEITVTVQLWAENVPDESETKVRLPVGVTRAPFEESVIVTVQLDAWFTTTGLTHATAVEVVRGLTITLAELLVLVGWAESPPYAPVTVALPVDEGVKVTEQVPADSVHVDELKDPFGPDSVNVTFPVGLMGVPGEVSVTVTVQEEAWFTTTGLEQRRAVEDDRAFTVILAAGLVLPLWDGLPPYAPVTRAVPVTDGVKVTEQLPEDSVQLVELNAPATPVSSNVRVPVGVVGFVEVSVTVAVQVEAWFTIREFGEQSTIVEDECCPIITWTKMRWISWPAVALIVML
jgi:hypothetical protein